MAIAIQKRPRSAGEQAASQVRYHRKTARGKVLKVLREVYVRDDIPCGVEACGECGEAFYADEAVDGPAGARHATLQRSGIENSLAEKPHLVVIDTNVVLHQVCCHTSEADATDGRARVICFHERDRAADSCE